jgi:hypothetical protein
MIHILRGVLGPTAHAGLSEALAAGGPAADAGVRLVDAADGDSPPVMSYLRVTEVTIPRSAPA